MKLMMIFSYFTDGFAYAGEAMAGRYIGSKNRAGLVSTVKYVFIWSMGIAALFMVLYGVAGMPMLRIMTSSMAAANACDWLCGIHMGRNIYRCYFSPDYAQCDDMGYSRIFPDLFGGYCPGRYWRKKCSRSFWSDCIAYSFSCVFCPSSG